MTKTVNTKEAVEISGKSAAAIRKAITDKKVKASKKGNSWEINRASLEKWAGVKTEKAAEKPKAKKEAPKQEVVPQVSEVDALKNEIDDLKKENLDLRVQIKELQATQCNCGCACKGNCTKDSSCGQRKGKSGLLGFLFPKS